MVAWVAHCRILAMPRSAAAAAAAGPHCCSPANSCGAATAAVTPADQALSFAGPLGGRLSI